MKPISNFSKVMLALCLAFTGWLVWPSGVYASADGCQMGFLDKTNSNTPQIDGNLASGEWDDAGSIQSGVQCLGFLRDWDGRGGSPTTSTLIDKELIVYSKRVGANLYIAFAVPDQTQGIGSLNGERIIIQIDPDFGNGAQLDNDFRIEISHKWNRDNLKKQLKRSTPGGCNSLGGWENVDAPSLEVDLGVIAEPLLHYVVEIKIALSEIGTPADDFGIAFAVINDLGYDSGTPDAHAWAATGVSFPKDLRISNSNNPLDIPNSPASCGWNIPVMWGTGYWLTAVGDVTISNLPVWWNSEAIEAFACQPQPGDVPTYEYYPAGPCRLVLRAKLHSTDDDVRRNVLFLWAQQGNNNNSWHFIELVENVLLHKGDNTISTQEWANMPKELLNHPCVRVYILPATDNPAFDRDRITQIQTPEDMAAFEATYYANGIGDHMTQKNISARTATETCPNAACQIASGFQFASFVYKQPLQMSEQPADDLLHARTTAGNQLMMTAEEFNNFSETAAILQFRANGSSPLLPNAEYNFIEDLGGAIQLVPFEMLDPQKEIDFQLEVSNNPWGTQEQVDRTVYLIADTYAPEEFKWTIQPQFTLKGEALSAGETFHLWDDTVLTEKGKPYIDTWIQPDRRFEKLCDPDMSWLTYDSCLVMTGQWPPKELIEPIEPACNDPSGLTYGACLLLNGEWMGLKKPPVEEWERYGLEKYAGEEFEKEQ